MFYDQAKEVLRENKLAKQPPKKAVEDDADEFGI
jgi:hypothetical protein